MPKLLRRRDIISLSAFAGWIAFVFVLAPGLIRLAYNGVGPAVLTDLISGRDVHPLERYLDAWWVVSAKGSAVLLLAFFSGYLVYRHWSAIKAAFANHTWTRATGGIAFLVGAWLGWWTALLEIAFRFAETGISAHPLRPPIEMLWMAPLVGAVLAGSLSWTSWRVGTRLRPNQSIFLPAAAGLSFLFFEFIFLFGPGVHPLSAVILSVGLAAQLARPLATWGVGLERMVARSSRWLIGATAVAVLWTSGIGSSNEGDVAREGLASNDGTTSVLLVILDTARAKSMSLYGSARATTPNIDRLARTGTVFERAIAPTPWTLPSHATFFTGLWPHEHGAGWEKRLGDEHVTLAEILNDQGYATGGFAANVVFANRLSGLAQGFQRFEDTPSLPVRIVNSIESVANLVEWGQKQRGSHRKLGRKSAEDVNAEVLDWLDDDVDVGRPFFAFLNYYDVHSEYEPHSPFDTLFSPPGDRFWIGDDWKNASTRHSEQELREIETSYDEAMAYLDYQVGALLDALEARGRLENTLVVVTSDHGEQFGEHDLLGHSNSLYQPAMRVPLLVVDPGARLAAGDRVDRRVTLRDLPATILDLTGVGSAIPGESMVRYVETCRTEEPILMQVDRGFVQGRMRGVLDGPWSYIHNYSGAVSEELYNLDEDPDELHNLAVSTPDAVSSVLRRMRLLVDSLGHSVSVPVVPGSTSEGSSQTTGMSPPTSISPAASDCPGFPE